MFLNKLTIEQKKAFLDLAYHIAKVDGEFEQSEKEMMEYYALEMNIEQELEKKLESKNDVTFGTLIDNIVGGLGQQDLQQASKTGIFFPMIYAQTLNQDTHNKEVEFDLDACLDIFDNKPSQKLLILELLGIVYANDEYHQEQKNVMEYILDYYGISSYLVTVYTEWTKTMISMQRQGNALINL